MKPLLKLPADFDSFPAWEAEAKGCLWSVPVECGDLGVWVGSGFVARGGDPVFGLWWC